VADDRQRRGLGYRLILRLIEDARSAGLRYAEGEVLRHNRAMLALARRAGFEVRRHPGDATLVKIALELQGDAATEAATPTLLAVA
jgi:acetyltransferase